MNKKILGFTLASLLTPAFVFAQVKIDSTAQIIIAPAQPKTLASVINIIIGYANQILVLMMAVAVVMFVFYIIKYFIKADADRSQAGQYVMWSLIGFFVILSMWGLVNVIQGTFGLKNETYRPAGWDSYTNIFPGGSSQRGSGSTTELK